MNAGLRAFCRFGAAAMGETRLHIEEILADEGIAPQWAGKDAACPMSASQTEQEILVPQAPGPKDTG